MVFKGVKNNPPVNATSLRNLMTDFVLENDDDDSVKTITNANTESYKSGIMEDWGAVNFTIVDQVCNTLS